MQVHTVSDKIKFIERCFGAGKVARNAKNIDIWCPVCNSPDRTKKKLAIHIEDDRNHCWVCGYRARTLIPLLRKFCTQEQLDEYIRIFVPESEREARTKRISLEIGSIERKPILPPDFKLLATALDSRDPDDIAALRYLFETRGLSERDLWFYKFGVSNHIRWHRRVIMPSFDVCGELNYYVGRAIDRNRKPKYDNIDVDKLPIIFNEINIDWTQPLALCEGPFDLVKCGENSVPLLGSDVNEESKLFEMIIINRTPVIVALDADMMETKVPRIVKKFQEYNVSVSVIDVRMYDKTDPGEMSHGEFADARENAFVPTWDSMLKNKLKRASRVALSRHI